jgi:hypothetical protein
MNATQVVLFDEQSNASTPEGDAPLGTLRFHDELTSIKNALASVESENGWMYLNFGTVFSTGDVFGDGRPGAYVLVRRDGVISDTGVHPVVSTTCGP